jgi:hypothetical protein
MDHINSFLKTQAAVLIDQISDCSLKVMMISCREINIFIQDYPLSLRDNILNLLKKVSFNKLIEVSFNQIYGLSDEIFVKIIINKQICQTKLD